MERTRFGEMPCSIARSLDLVGEWWTPLIVRDLYLGVDRFDDIVRNLGVSRNLLTRRLTDLVAHGLVFREAYQERPARYRYGLTEAGRELVPVLMALMAWGDRWAPPAGGPPVELLHTGCGRTCTPTVGCSACGEAIDADSVEVRPGPGAAPGPGTWVLAERAAGRDGTGRDGVRIRPASRSRRSVRPR